MKLSLKEGIFFTFVLESLNPFLQLTVAFTYTAYKSVRKDGNIAK